MDIFVQLGVTLASWLVLMFIGTNLIGMLVRGIVGNPLLDELASQNEVLAQEHRKSEGVANLVAVFLIAAFLGVLYYFWNIALVIAAVMLMLSRIPDLVWELRSLRKSASEVGTKPTAFILTSLLAWSALPVVWYSLYRM